MKWFWPPSQRRAHLFADDSTRSLCGKWDHLGLPPDEAFDVADIDSDTKAVAGQDCAECVKRAVKACQ